VIRIGTRGSALARAQAGWVADRLDADTELVIITTAGDRGVEKQDKSRWVSELERALAEQRIDLAVHSAKDVPAELPAGMELVAIPERADPRDAICGAPSLDAVPSGACIGTSSLRRAAQIRALREDVEVVAVRGNVDTRLAKLAEGVCDALVLAAAGLGRLGREPDGLLDDLVPAAGQGALALEARSGTIPQEQLAQLRDPAATAAVGAERALTRALGASCNSAVGAWARPAADGRLELAAWVGRPDGSAWLADRVHGAADEVGAICAERMLSAGARELLEAP
jgi:hydroxymethylbilane synthase